MKCSRCQSDNLPDAKFCIECGALMEFHCPKCGAMSRGRAKFCQECGHELRESRPSSAVDYSQPLSYVPRHLADKILALRPSIEGERKQVTVLFADVKGFTSISEKLDPEDVQTLISGCLSLFTEEIHRYEGTIAQFLGDGVLALFGAPIAHEDAPQRALYAALAIQQRLKGYADQVKKQGIDFNMRIGLNTGLVVVGKIGDDLTMQYTAMGDTVNLASRMESAAQPGTIQVSDNTYRLTEGYFEFKPLGEIEVKGKKEPVRAYELRGVGRARTRISASEMRGLTPFVGRHKEMEQLAECYDRAKKGRGQVVGIVGEPGVGKSRLLLQLKSMLPQGDYSYLECECLHYGEAMAYLPISNALKSYFDIKGGEAEVLSQHKLRRRIGELDTRIIAMLPALQELLSLKVDDDSFLKLDPQQRRARIFEAIWSLIISESQKRPVVLVMEDLHWIDKASEEFLSYLIGRLGGAHILLLLLYRPEYNHSWGTKSYYSQIRVDELTLEASAEMVQVILKGAKVAQDLTDLILHKAGGNPLFMEEFTRTLLETGYIKRKNGCYVLTVRTSDIQVPETIQGIVAARMDRLERDLKETMQVASVIGREFSFHILQKVTGTRENLKTCLLELQALEFIYERGIFPELEYVFRHALTQQVAYASVLIKKRKELHERIGQAIEASYHNRLEELCEGLAFHFKNGVSTDKAIRYLIKAGEKGFARYAVEESHHHFKEAYDLLSLQVSQVKGAEAQLVDLLIKWAYVFYFRGDFKRLSALLETHKGIAESLEDKAKLGMYYAWLGFSLSVSSSLRDSYHYLHEALRIGQGIRNDRVIGYSYCWLIYTCACMGFLDEALASGEKALEVSRRLEDDQYLYYKSLGMVGYTYHVMGYKGKVFEAGKAILEYSARHGNIRGEVMGHWVMSMGYLVQGDMPAAIEQSRQGAELAVDPFYKIGMSKRHLSLYCTLNGDLQEAEDLIKECLEFSCEFEGVLPEHLSRAGQHLVCFLKGDINALAAAEDVANKMQQMGMKGLGCSQLLSSIATGFRLLSGVMPDANQKARHYFGKAIEVAREIGAKASLGEAYLGLGQLYGAEGDKDKARQYISQAVPLFEQCELDAKLKQAKEALESLK